MELVASAAHVQTLIYGAIYAGCLEAVLAVGFRSISEIHSVVGIEREVLEVVADEVSDGLHHILCLCLGCQLLVA